MKIEARQRLVPGQENTFSLWMDDHFVATVICQDEKVVDFFRLINAGQAALEKEKPIDFYDTKNASMFSKDDHTISIDPKPDWEQRRWELAKEAFLLRLRDDAREDVVDEAVKDADALIAEFRKGEAKA